MVWKFLEMKYRNFELFEILFVLMIGFKFSFWIFKRLIYFMGCFKLFIGYLLKKKKFNVV